jgi:hypothetical protein
MHVFAGSYGSVAEAIDHLTHQRVAIKKIPNVFEVGFDRCLLFSQSRNNCFVAAHTNQTRLGG